MEVISQQFVNKFGREYAKLSMQKDEHGLVNDVRGGGKGGGAGAISVRAY